MIKDTFKRFSRPLSRPKSAARQGNKGLSGRLGAPAAIGFQPPFSSRPQYKPPRATQSPYSTRVSAARREPTSRDVLAVKAAKHVRRFIPFCVMKILHAATGAGEVKILLTMSRSRGTYHDLPR
jgi:hypothetical protein